MNPLAYIDYGFYAQQREEWRTWLQAKAEQRRLSDPSAKVEA
jgi:hypothetical protein